MTAETTKGKPIKGEKLDKEAVQEACRRALRDSLGGP